MQRIVLVGVLGHRVARDCVFQPHPLEHPGLEHRGRRVGIVFEQFGGPLPVIGEIEAAIEARVLPLPAGRDEGPEPFRDAQHLQHALVRDRARDQLAAHRVELGGRRLEVVFDLLQGERVIGALVPVAFARDGVKRKAGCGGLFFPVGPLVAGNALHEVYPPADGRKGLLCAVVPNPPRWVPDGPAEL